MKLTIRALLVFSFTLMSMTGCLPNHLTHLDGMIALGTLSKTTPSRVILKDAQGIDFYLESPQVLVSFEVNRIGASFLNLSDEQHTAKFYIPRHILNQRSPSVFLPATTSNQPYDLQINESTKILKSWTHYREEDDPVYIQTCSNSVGNPYCSQTLIGFDSEYFSDIKGQVEYSVSLTLLSPTQGQGTPTEVEKIAEIHLITGVSEERLSTRKISQKEYLSHQTKK